MKSILIFLAGGAVAALLVWGFVASQPAQVAQVPDTTHGDTTTDTSGTTGTATTPGNPVTEGSHLLYTVNYNNGAFTPAVLNLKKGDAVKFVNKDNLTLRVSVVLSSSTSTQSNATDSHSLGKGGTYSFSFSLPGVWVIQNINDTGVGMGGGVINVR